MRLEERRSYRILLLTRLRSVQKSLASVGHCFTKGLSFHAICQNTIGGGGMKSFSYQKGCKHWVLHLPPWRGGRCLPSRAPLPCSCHQPREGGLENFPFKFWLWASWMPNQKKWGILADTLLFEMWRVTQAVLKLHVRDDTIGNQIKNHKYFVSRAGGEGMAPV